MKLTVGLGYKISYVLYVIGLVLEILYFRNHTGLTNDNSRLFQLLSVVLLVVFTYVIISLNKKIAIKEIFEKIVRYFFIGAIFVVSTSLIISIIFHSEFRLEFLNSQLIYGTIIFSLTAAVTEELIFRGIVYSLIAHLFRRTNQRILIAILISSFIFTLSHLKQGRPLMAYSQIFLMGTIFCLISITHGNLWPCIGLHWGFDFLTLLNGGQHIKLFQNSRGIFPLDPIIGSYYLHIQILALVFLLIYFVMNLNLDSPNNVTRIS